MKRIYAFLLSFISLSLAAFWIYVEYQAVQFSINNQAFRNSALEWSVIVTHSSLIAISLGLAIWGFRYALREN